MADARAMADSLISQAHQDKQAAEEAAHAAELEAQRRENELRSRELSLQHKV